MSGNLAPSLSESLEWVNTEIPVSLDDYRGRVVILIFWTYSNHHSLRLIRRLIEVADEHEGGVVLVGIHSPKFTHERDSANVAKAINRQFIRFPVASDVGFETWHEYQIQSWPSAAIIDATGKLDQVVVGDNSIEVIKGRAVELLDDAARRNMREFARLPTAWNPEGQSVLKFPTAVLEARGLLYVSDCGNNRILEINKSGRVQRVFGSGSPGFWDGLNNNCGFNLPRGLAYAENYLYVADTQNHAIRRVNLFNGEVETILGFGRGGFEMTPSSRKLREIGLPMPVGLAFDGPELYISAAAAGQIWKLDLANGTVGWFAGTGQAGLVDGEPVQAAFAQPLGMTVADGYLYVADADASALREIRCQSGHVSTRIGQHSFLFGNADGVKSDALLQFPMDVAVRPRSPELWIADSFNNRLRVYDLKSNELSTPKLDYEFNEPSGIAIAGNTLWVANTNAHEIVRVDIVSRQCEKLKLEDTHF